MLSTPLLDAASISCTSTDAPEVISTHASQTLHGVGVGPFTHDRHFAKMRAAVVLPTPRAPQNRNAWWSRDCAIALFSVAVTCSCPTISSKVCGRYFRARTRYDMGH